MLCAMVRWGDMKYRFPTGAKNPMWKGGRTIAQHGYVLVRVGKSHRLADVRGYAYEHRVVAEEMLKRPLRKGEVVHHKNGNKMDNRPENLMVVKSHAHHRMEHRKKNRKIPLRHPDELNPTIKCICGCGAIFKKYDDANRPRQYISGHNLQSSPAQEGILNALKQNPLSRTQLAKKINKAIQPTASTLSKLKKHGKVVQIKRGLWALT